MKITLTDQEMQQIREIGEQFEGVVAYSPSPAWIIKAIVAGATFDVDTTGSAAPGLGGEHAVEIDMEAVKFGDMMRASGFEPRAVIDGIADAMKDPNRGLIKMSRAVAGAGAPDAWVQQEIAAHNRTAEAGQQ